MIVFSSARSVCPLSIHSAKARLSFSAIVRFSSFPKYPKLFPFPCAVNQSLAIATFGFFSICFIFQVFLTIGGVTKFIPSTGVTLPLISYGGSSVASTLIIFAVMQGIFIIAYKEDDEDEEEQSNKKNESNQPK